MLKKNFKYFVENDILQVEKSILDKMKIFDKITAWSYIDKLETTCYLKRRDWLFFKYQYIKFFGVEPIFKNTKQTLTKSYIVDYLKNLWHHPRETPAIETSL